MEATIQDDGIRRNEPNYVTVNYVRGRTEYRIMTITNWNVSSSQILG